MKINYYFNISIILKRQLMVKTSVKSCDILTLPTALPLLFMTSLETPRKIAHFIDSDSDGEIPEINLTLRIQPYMYEPIASSTDRTMTNSPESESEIDQAEEASSKDFRGAKFRGGHFRYCRQMVCTIVTNIICRK